jgi:hypothetical protein
MNDTTNNIKLTNSEIRGRSRVAWAEELIRQLPSDHEGRNSWLMNYGTGEEAQRLRSERGIPFDDDLQAAGDSPGHGPADIPPHVINPGSGTGLPGDDRD